MDQITAGRTHIITDTILINCIDAVTPLHRCTTVTHSQCMHNKPVLILKLQDKWLSSDEMYFAVIRSHVVHVWCCDHWRAQSTNQSFVGGIKDRDDILICVHLSVYIYVFIASWIPTLVTNSDRKKKQGWMKVTGMYRLMYNLWVEYRFFTWNNKERN